MQKFRRALAAVSVGVLTVAVLTAGAPSTTSTLTVGIAQADTTQQHPLFGVGFDPFVQGNDPNQGDTVSPDDVPPLLTTLAPYTTWIRTWGCTNESSIGQIAHELGLKVAMGAWISADPDANQRELNCVIELNRRGDIDMAVIGSEVLDRGDLTEGDLINYIDLARENLSVQVTTGESVPILLAHTDVLNHVNLVLAHIYPYQSGIAPDAAIASVDTSYSELAAASPVPVWVGETGFADCAPNGSPQAAATYLAKFVSWAQQHNVPYFYFQAMDAPYKALYQPGGACFGLFTSSGTPKPLIANVLMHPVPTQQPAPPPPTSAPTAGTSIEITTIPPNHSSAPLEGVVHNADASQYRLTAYIYVDTCTAGWWGAKPLWATPLNAFEAQTGRFRIPLVSGGCDSDWKQAQVLLMPAKFAPPVLSGAKELPADFKAAALASVTVQRTP